MSEQGIVEGAWTRVHPHENGREALEAATERARNTTIVIGADPPSRADCRSTTPTACVRGSTTARTTASRPST